MVLPIHELAWQLLGDGHALLDQGETGVGPSVLLTADVSTAEFVISVFIGGERADGGGQVEASDRSRILDAIAMYGTESVVAVIEPERQTVGSAVRTAVSQADPN
jgi:hypothetical protein